MSFINNVVANFGRAKKGVDKANNVLTICISALIAIFFGGYLLNPSATASFLGQAPAWVNGLLNSFFPQNGQAMDFGLGTLVKDVLSIEIPVFSYFVGSYEVPVFSASVIILVILFIAMVASCYLAPISSLTSGFVCVVGWGVSFKLVDAYNYLIQNGNTTWEAAGKCFWPLVILYTIILLNGLLGIGGFGARINDGVITISEVFLCFILGTLVSFIISLVLNGINWLIMGLGGAWFIFVGMVLICLVVIALEILDLMASNQ